MAQFNNWGKVEDEVKSKVNREEQGGGWVLVGYSDHDAKAPHTLTFVASGTGGCSELKAHLKPDQFAYGLIRLEDNKHQLQHTHKTTYRDVFITYQGQNVSILKRGKLVEHIGAVQKKFEPHHAEIVVKDKSLLSDAVLLEKSAPGSGSHIVE